MNFDRSAFFDSTPTRSFTRSTSTVTVDVDMVKERVGVLSKNADLSKFIL